MNFMKKTNEILSTLVANCLAIRMIMGGGGNSYKSPTQVKSNNSRFYFFKGKIPYFLIFIFFVLFLSKSFANNSNYDEIIGRVSKNKTKNSIIKEKSIDEYINSEPDVSAYMGGTSMTIAVGSSSICSGNSTTVTYTWNLGDAPQGYAQYSLDNSTWYDMNAGPLATITSGTAKSISPTSTTTYYGRVVGNTGTVQLTATAKTVTVNTSAGPTTVTGGGTFCDNAVLTAKPPCAATQNFGDDTGNYAYDIGPFYGFYNYSRSCSLILRSELECNTGIITHLSVYVGEGDTHYFSNMTIRLSKTTATTAPTTFPGNGTLVYSGSYTFNKYGWATIDITDFNWDADNLLIETTWQGSWSWNYPGFVYTTQSSNLHTYSYSDTGMPTTGTATTMRPDWGLTFFQPETQTWETSTAGGTGNSYLIGPLNGLYNYSRTASLILRSEVSPEPTTITHLSFYVGTAGSHYFSTIQIHLSTTTATTVSSTFPSNGVNVYNGPYTFSSTGWVTLDITDFNWKSGNLLIETMWAGTYSSNYPYFTYTNTGANLHCYNYSDDGMPSSGTVTTQRPLYRLTFTKPSVYWQNTTSNGTSTATPSLQQTVTNSGTYYFRARSAGGCWGQQGSATVSIDKTNPTYNGYSNVTGYTYFDGTNYWVKGGETFTLDIKHSDDFKVQTQYFGYNHDGCTPNSCGDAPNEIKSYNSNGTFTDWMADDNYLNIIGTSIVAGAWGTTTITNRWSTYVSPNCPEWDWKMNTYLYDWCNHGLGYTALGPWLKVDKTAPTRDDITVNDLCWSTDGTNTYTITVKSTEPRSGFGGAYGIMALINYNLGEPNAGGYFAWHPTNYVHGANQMACTGGGYVSKSTDWGGSRIDLVSASTSIVGNQRTVVFTVRPHSDFIENIGGNKISMYTSDNCNNYGGWDLFNVNFTTMRVPNTPTAATTICNGGSVTLNRSNNPPTGVTYYWQTSPTGTSTANSGSSYTVSPSTTTTYYIRPYSSSGCWGKASAGVTVTVNTPPTAPTLITGTTTICAGGSTTLTATGGSEGSGCTYQWYAGGCGSGTVLGTTSSLSVSPSTTTTYYVRRVGTSPCNNITTACASVTVTVTPNANAGTVSAGTTPQCIGQSTTYSVSGVNLGGNGTGSWSSSNTSVATVNSSGLVSAVGAGTCDIIYTISGGCGSPVSSQASYTVSPNMTATSPSPESVCINTALSPITISTTNATGIGTPTGLPASVTASWTSNKITISGTPTVSGVYNYTIPLTGGCGTVSASGTITVNAPPTDITISNGGYLWYGQTSTDWETASNWLVNSGTQYQIASSAPSSSVNAFVTNVSGTCAPPNQPTVTSVNGICNNLTVSLTGNLSLAANKKLTIKGNLNNEGTITSNSGNIDIAGNWTNTGTFSAGTGTVTFNGNTTQVIKAGSSAFNNVKFENSAGFNVNEAMTINGNADFNNGIVNFMTAGSLTFSNSATSNIGNSTSYVNGIITKTGSSAFNFATGDGVYWGPCGIAAPSASSTITAQYFHSAGPLNWTFAYMCPASNLHHTSGVEHWLLTSTSSTPNVTLYWNTASDVVEPNDLVVAHYNASSSCWENKGAANITGDANAGSVTNAIPFTSYSPITLGTKTKINPLPVELTLFSAECDNNNNVQLYWTTASEINNDYFEIQRSTQGIAWEVIARVQGAGFSNTSLNYDYLDRENPNANTYYRLRQVDYDGRSKFSDIISIRCENNMEKPTISIYPNPFNSILNIEFKNWDMKSAEIELVDITSRTIKTWKLENTLQNFVYEVNLNNLNPAMYMLKIKTSSGVIMRKIEKQ